MKDSEIFVEPIGAGYFFQPAARVIVSYKGMKVRQTIDCPIVGEIDWMNDDEGHLSVDRSNLYSMGVLFECENFLRYRAADLVSKEIGADSPFFFWNNTLFPGPLDVGGDLRWLVVDWHSLWGAGRWSMVKFPAVLTRGFLSVAPLLDANFRTLFYDEKETMETLFRQLVRFKEPATWRGKEVQLVRTLLQHDADDSSDGSPWDIDRMPPDCIAYIEDPTLFRVEPIWSTAPHVAQVRSKPKLCNFPPIWEDLLGVDTGYGKGKEIYFNCDHPIANELARIDMLPTKSIGLGVLAEAEKALGSSFDNMESAHRFIAWVVLNIKSTAEWGEFIASRADIVRKIWWSCFRDQAFSSETLDRPILFWFEGDSPDESFLKKLTISGLEMLRRKVEIDAHLPNPGADWTIKLQVERLS